jgi:hypothetical protein
MKFVLIYTYDPSEAGPSRDEVSHWLAFEQEVKDAGAYVYEAGFQPARKARTLSVRNGEVETVDGPATAPDAVAGFWVVDVPAMEDALVFAERIPTAQYGKVEVRPVVEFEG